MHWVIKDKGESWTGQYFRDIILMQHVFPFLTDEENVIDLDNVIFVHDKAPHCKKKAENNKPSFCVYDR